MRIDAYTHFFPKKFFDKMKEVAGDYKDMGKRVRSLPALYDLDFRKKIVDGPQGLSADPVLSAAAARKFASPTQIDEIIRSIINDGFAELIAKERDHFPGWVAQVSLAAPDAGAAEARARDQGRRARRADLHQRRRQADRPAGIRAVLGQDERARQAGLDSSRRAARRRPTIRCTRRSRSTKSGGGSAGPTRPPAPWRGWCGPRPSTSIPT